MQDENVHVFSLGSSYRNLSAFLVGYFCKHVRCPIYDWFESPKLCLTRLQTASPLNNAILSSHNQTQVWSMHLDPFLSLCLNMTWFVQVDLDMVVQNLSFEWARTGSATGEKAPPDKSA